MNNPAEPSPSHETASQRLAEIAREGFPMSHILDVREALSMGANPNQMASSGRSILAHACEAGKIDVVKLLLDFGALADYSADGGPPEVSPLIAAAQTGLLAMLALLLRHDADPSLADAYSWTPLMHATRHPECAAALLARGASPTQASPLHKSTALMACMRDRGYEQNLRLLQSAKLLIDAGANLHAKNAKGKTALDLAEDNPMAVEFILREIALAEAADFSASISEAPQRLLGPRL